MVCRERQRIAQVCQMADLLVGLVRWNTRMPEAHAIPFEVREILRMHILPTYQLIWPDIPAGIACWQDIDWICGPGIENWEVQNVKRMFAVGLGPIIVPYMIPH